MATAIGALLAVIAPVAAEPFTATSRARTRTRATSRGSTGAVHRESHITVGAEHGLAATAAAQERAVTTPRHQQHRLFTAIPHLDQAIQQGPTEQAAMTLGQLLAHVNQAHWRQGSLPNPFGQLQQPETTLLERQPGLQ